MKKNILFRILALVIFAMPLQSCLYEQKDIFKQSSSVRLTEAMEHAQNILMGSEHGWLFEIYPESTQGYGGFAFTLKFNKMDVEVMSELGTGTKTSYYKMTNDNGPVLIFDTYNDFLHLFSTPSSSAYESFGGDYEYVIVSAEKNLVTLRGPRSGNTLYMTPLAEPAADYLAKVAKVEESFIMTGANGTVGGKNVKVSIDTDYRQLTFKVDEKTFSVAYTLTDNGLRFYEPVEAGEIFSEFRLTEDGNGLEIADGPAAGTVLTAEWPEGYRPYKAYEGKYKFNYSKGSFEVSLVPAGDGATYYMQGVNDNYELVLTYSKGKGTLSLLTQTLTKGGEYVKTSNNEYIGMVSWDAAKGYINYGATIGLVTKWNGDEEHPVYELVDNAVWGTYTVTSYYFYRFSGPSLSSSTRIGALNVSAYYPFSQTYQITYITTLEKID